MREICSIICWKKWVTSLKLAHAVLVHTQPNQIENTHRLFHTTCVRILIRNAHFDITQLYTDRSTIAYCLKVALWHEPKICSFRDRRGFWHYFSLQSYTMCIFMLFRHNCMCSARFIGGSLEGHTIRITRVVIIVIHTQISCVICENRNIENRSAVIWDWICKLNFWDEIWYTHGLYCCILKVLDHSKLHMYAVKFHTQPNQIEWYTVIVQSGVMSNVHVAVDVHIRENRSLMKHLLHKTMVQPRLWHTFPYTTLA